MKLSIFGSTGAVGEECLAQAIEAGHDVTVLVRNPGKLPEALRANAKLTVVHGNGLDAADVAEAIPLGTDAVLFAIGVDKNSPEDLCTKSTRNILAAMKSAGTRRFVWVGGGSTLHPKDRVTFGAKFVELFAQTFMGLRHRDKHHQLALLEANKQVDWIGLRPLQIRKGERREQYRVGYDTFSGMSKVSFADVGHAMLRMLDDDTWVHEAPIIQY